MWYLHSEKVLETQGDVADEEEEEVTESLRRFSHPSLTLTKRKLFSKERPEMQQEVRPGPFVTTRKGRGTENAL